jgi:hypothetical protein
MNPTDLERIKRKLAAGQWGDRGQFPDRTRALAADADGQWTVVDDGGGFYLGGDDDLLDFERQMDARGYWVQR